MLLISNLNNNRLNLSSHAKTLSIVRKLSLNISISNICFLPRFDFLRFRLFSGILGFIPRLNILFLFLFELYTPSKLITLFLIFIPIFFVVFTKLSSAEVNNTVSFLLPGALINGVIILQFLSHIATTLSPLWCLCPFSPKLSPLFLLLLMYRLHALLIHLTFFPQIISLL